MVTLLDANTLEDRLRAVGLWEDFSDVPQSLRLGFTTGLSSPPSSTFTPANHNSSSLDSSFISSYITSEHAAGRYADPFTRSRLFDLIGHFRSSPLGLVPKGPSSFRLIQDLSFPRNDPTTASPNSLINSDDFPCEWGTFADASDLILAAPAGSEAATFDVTGAYRCTPVRPDEQNWLVVQWEGEFWIDRAVCFGLASSAGLWGRIADCILALARRDGWCTLAAASRSLLR